MDIVQEILKHLKEVQEDSSIQLKSELLDWLDSVSCERLGPRACNELLGQISATLPSLQQDPSPLCTLVERVVTPETVTFSNILAIKPPVDFVAGLTSEVDDVVLAILTLLQKASLDLAGCCHIAGQREIVLNLVQAWLSTRSTTVAARAGNVLECLLRQDDTASVDCLQTPNLMWRRILRDADVYSQVFELCDVNGHLEDWTIVRRKSVSLTRLLALILKLGAAAFWTPQLEPVESKHHASSLLDFAFRQSLLLQHDDLLFQTLIDFATRFLCPNHLRILRSTGVHEACLRVLFEPDQNPPWIIHAAIGYFKAYCHHNSKNLANEDQLLARLEDHIRGRTASGPQRVENLQRASNIFSALPQAILWTCFDGVALLSDLYVLQPQAFTLHCFIRVFSAANQNRIEDQQAARLLFFCFLEAKPQFWNDLVLAASTFALPDLVLAAYDFVGALATTTWHPLEHASLPSESWLMQRCHVQQSLPCSGMEVLLAERNLPKLVDILAPSSSANDTSLLAARQKVASDILMQLEQSPDLAEVRSSFSTLLNRLTSRSQDVSSHQILTLNR